MKKVILSLFALYGYANSQMYVPIVPAPAPPQVPQPATPNLIPIDPLPPQPPIPPPQVPPQVVPINPDYVPINPAAVPPVNPVTVAPVNPLPEPPVTIPSPLPQPPVTIPDIIIIDTPPPVLPAGQAYGAFGQVCETSATASCTTPTEVLASQNNILCENPFDCCLCAAIECTNCITFNAGQSAIFGVAAVTINGQSAQRGGAFINCYGLESCSKSAITATNIKMMTVSGVQGAANAVVTITNPTSDFKLQCTTLSSCAGLKFEIIIPAPAAGSYGLCGYSPLRIGGFQCSGAESCKGADISITNRGCNKLVIENIECTETDACLGANFNLVGDIDVTNCDLGVSGNTATGLSKCYQNLPALLCQEPGACQGMVKTLTNPTTAFSLQCGDMGSCAQAQLTLYFNSAPWYNPMTGVEFAEPTTWIDGFKFSGQGSAAGAVITIFNDQRGKTLEIENVECAAPNACTSTTFILGKDVEIANLLCLPGTCAGCMVKVDPTDIGIPCSIYAPVRR